MSTISPEELVALAQFKEQIADVLRKDHDDYTLVKWLRARRLKVSDSEIMYRKSMQWRKLNKMDEMKAKYTEPEVMKKYYPGGICGHDKDGRPVHIDMFTRTDMRGIVASLPRDEILRAIVSRMEFQIDYLKEQSERKGKVIDQVVQILDMDGFGRKHMWIPGAELISDVLRTLDNNYPEMLYRTYIINAPRLFHYGYGFIKGFLSEDTRKKFIFLGNNWKDELLKVIDAAELPVHFGGTKTDPDGDIYCKSLIGIGGEVPEEYYMSEEDNDQEKKSKTVLIKKGNVHKMDVNIDKGDLIIKWYIRSDRDLLFGILFRSNNEKEETTLQPVTKTHCSKFAHMDNIMCEKPGTYTFVFDNRDSWWYDRNVTYNIEIIDSDTEMHRLQERDIEITQL